MRKAGEGKAAASKFITEQVAEPMESGKYIWAMVVSRNI